MATFLEEAQALLSPEEFSNLQSLSLKVSQMTSTTDEDDKLKEMKTWVKTAIADRDRLKNLQFLENGNYSLVDILKTIKATEPQIKQALKVLFPAPDPTITETIAIYTDGNGKKFELKWGERLDRELTKLIVEGKIETLIKNLTPFGKTWINSNTTPDIGPYAGKPTYHNISALNLRFKFDKAELKKALKIK